MDKIYAIKIVINGEIDIYHIGQEQINGVISSIDHIDEFFIAKDKYGNMMVEISDNIPHVVTYTNSDKKSSVPFY